jgi:molecular chaperone IbpA
LRPTTAPITAEQNVVAIQGSTAEKAERDFLCRAISTRHFKRQFSLADYVQVKGAAFDNGLLRIELVREIPEARNPRRIAINGRPITCRSWKPRPLKGLARRQPRARRAAALPSTDGG